MSELDTDRSATSSVATGHRSGSSGNRHDTFGRPRERGWPVEQLHANLAAMDVTLPAGQRALIDEVSAPTVDLPATITNINAIVAFE